jgi:hypothetical protein
MIYLSHQYSSRALYSLPIVPRTGTLSIQYVLQWYCRSARKGHPQLKQHAKSSPQQAARLPSSQVALNPLNIFPLPRKSPRSLHLRFPISLSIAQCPTNPHPPSPPVKTSRPSSSKYTRPTFYENFFSNRSLIDIFLCKYTQVHIAQSFGEWSRAIFCKAFFIFLYLLFLGPFISF